MLIWVTTELWEIFKSLAGSKLKIILLRIKTRKLFKEIETNLQQILLSKYQNELYYNDLDGFLYRNRIFKKLIENNYSSQMHEFASSTELIDSYIANFMQEFPKHTKYQLSIKQVLKLLFEIVFNALNKVPDDETTRIVTNTLKECIGELSIKIRELDDHVLELQRDSKIEHANIQNGITNIEKNIEGLLFAANNSQYNNISYSFVSTGCWVSKPSIVPYASKRQEAVSRFAEISSKVNWLHITGSVWSGKSQFLCLLSEKLVPFLWIGLKYHNQYDALCAFLRHHILSEHRSETLLKSFFNSIGDIKYIFVDDLPDISINTSFTELFLSFVIACTHKGITIISTGLSKVDYFTLEKVNDLRFQLECIPDLSTNEICEILSNFGAPTYMIDDKRSSFILSISGQKPAAIMVMINHLKSLNWKVNDKEFLKLLSLDFTELNDLLQKIIAISIPDKEERDLLYRVAFIGHPIPIDGVKTIAAEDPAIGNLNEKITALKNGWIDFDGQEYGCSSIIRKIATDNLKKDVQRKISEAVAKLIISKHTLNQLDISRIIMHFCVAEKYDDAGYFYCQALQYMCDERISDDSMMIAHMWRSMPLPTQMLSILKAQIRLLQIKYNAMQNEDTSYATQDLISIAEQNDECRMFITMGAGVVMLSAPSVGSQLFKAGLRIGLPTEFIGEKIISINPVSANFLLWGATIERTVQLKDWYHTLTGVSSTQLEDLKQSYEINELIYLVLERPRTNISNNKCDINAYIKLLEDMYHFAIEKTWNSLLIRVIQSLMRTYAYNLKSFDESVIVFQKEVQKKPNDVRLNAHLYNCMGLIAQDQKQYELSKEYFSKSIENNGEVLFNTIELLSTYLGYSLALLKTEEIDKSLSYIDMALNIAASKEDIDMAVKLKVYGEYVIHCYEAGVPERMLDTLINIIQSVSNPSQSGRELFIGVLSHCLVYINRELLTKDPPKYVNKGEPYARPSRGMFWSNTNEAEFAKLYNESRWYAVHVFASQLMDYYNHDAQSEDLLMRAIPIYDQLEDKAIISALTSVDSFIIGKLIDCGYIEEALKIYLDAQNSKVLNTENFSYKSSFFRKDILFFTSLVANHLLSNSLNDIKLPDPLITGLEKMYVDDTISFEWHAFVMILKSAISGEVFGDRFILMGNQFSGTEFSFLQIASYLLYTVNGEPEKSLKIQIMILKDQEVFIRHDIYYLRNILFVLLRRFWEKVAKGYYAKVSPIISESIINLLLGQKDYSFKSIKKLLLRIKLQINLDLEDQNLESWILD